MRLSCLPIGVGLALVALAARADSEEPPVASALVVGATTALVPFAFGATLIASTHDRTTQNAAVYTMEAGLTLAPFVAHGIVGESPLAWELRDRCALVGSLSPHVLLLGDQAS